MTHVFKFIFKGLFKNIVFRSVALITKKLDFFFTDRTFFRPIPYPWNTLPLACLGLTLIIFNCDVFVKVACGCMLLLRTDIDRIDLFYYHCYLKKGLKGIVKNRAITI